MALMDTVRTWDDDGPAIKYECSNQGTLPPISLTHAIILPATRFDQGETPGNANVRIAVPDLKLRLPPRKELHPAQRITHIIPQFAHENLLLVV